MTSTPSSKAPFWRADLFDKRRAGLLERAAIMKAVRAHFDDQGFVETDTPALQVSPGVEPHIKTFAVELQEPFGQGQKEMHLHTSPEFAMKKLLAGGMERIYQLARVYRNGERSPSHSPEFVMLEWYRAKQTLADIMADCEALMRALPVWRADCAIDQPFERLSVNEAFVRDAGFDVLETISDPYDPDPDPSQIRLQASMMGMECDPDDRWEDVFFRILLEVIEPRLGYGRPTFLMDYPACMASLARRNPDDPRVAERFELYVDGVELCNAFQELTDPVEQRARFDADAELKKRLHGLDTQFDEDFLAAMAHMPDCAGVAMGFDRLVMLATGAQTLEEVLWAPVA